MNNKPAYDASKIYDQILLERLHKANYLESRLSNATEDQKQFWDILVKNKEYEIRVDTKYPHTKSNSYDIWFEYPKIVDNGKSQHFDELWYFIDDVGSTLLSNSPVYHVLMFKKNDIAKFLFDQYQSHKIRLFDSQNDSKICWISIKDAYKVAYCGSRENSINIEKWIDGHYGKSDS